MITTQTLFDGPEVFRMMEALASLVIDELLPGFCVRVSFSADPTALRTVNNAVVVNVATFHHVCLSLFISLLPHFSLPNI